MSRFPRWRVLQRAFARTTDDVGTLLGSVLVALAFGFVGAFVVVPKNADWGARFVSAVGVAALATVGVWVLLLVFHALRYRAGRFRDPVWEVRWALSLKVYPSGFRTSSNAVSLRCKTTPPVNVAALGHVEAIVRMPDGRLFPMPQKGMGGDAYGLGFAATGTFGPPAPGLYEVR